MITDVEARSRSQESFSTTLYLIILLHVVVVVVVVSLKLSTWNATFQPELKEARGIAQHSVCLTCMKLWPQPSAPRTPPAIQYLVEVEGSEVQGHPSYQVSWTTT